MTTRIGVWIDQQQARIFHIDEDGSVESTVIQSGVERQPRSLGKVNNLPPGASTGSAEPKHLERRREHTLQEFYRSVLDAVEKADELAVVGPGLTKVELKKLMQKRNGMAEKLRCVEGMDKKLTEGQVAARMREIFHLEPERKIA